jgi:hypothetical protein
MKRLAWVFAFVGMGLPSLAPAASAVEHPVLDRVNAALAAGEITYDEALLNRFYFMFDPSRLAPEFVVPGAPPVKCGTPLVFEFEQNKGQLNPRTVETIEGYLGGGGQEGAEALATFISPDGIFQLTYSTTGGNAVPATDGDLDGVPDFVEWIAGYLDASHDQIVNVEGFAYPPPNPTYYPISFEAMSGVYGYTQVIGGDRTRIVLHNNFLGFPPNDDPEGNQKGAAKVTCIHEYKHASQYVHSHWTEGQWVELDATWQEDIGPFDVVNDYYNYMGTINCPIRGPHVTMDPGSYEDAVWQHYLTQTHGLAFMQDFWAWRETHTGQEEKESYHQILLTYGSTWEEAWEEFTKWNALSGPLRCNDDLPGYEEACGYVNSGSNYTVTTYPDEDRLRSIPRVAANFGIYQNLNTLDGVRIIVDGPVSATPVTINALLDLNNGTWALEPLPLDGNGDVDQELATPASMIEQMTLVMSNTSRTLSQNVTVSVIEGSGSVAVPGAAELLGTTTHNFPNPFNPTTLISYDLPVDAPVSLEVFDSNGRLVRTLIERRTVKAGLNQVRWDGRGDAGEQLATGVYYYRLTAGPRELYRKMILVK